MKLNADRKKLYEKAEWLGSRIDTEWAEENENLYEVFEALLEDLYNLGEITANEYNEVGSIAFYDFDMKEEN